MIRVLLVPSSDYLGHPFPQRHNQIFERLHNGKNFEVHVVRFILFDKPKLKTNLVVHELDETGVNHAASYYLINTVNHASEIRRIVKRESIDVVVLSNLTAPFAYTLMDKLLSMRVPTVFDLPDYYPASAAGYIFDVRSIQGKLLAQMFDFMLRFMIRRANAVTAASHVLVKYAEAAGARSTAYVPNGISECFLKLHDGGVLREKLGFDQKDIVVGYIGSIEFWLDMKPLIYGVAKAAKQGTPVKLLLIGGELHTNHIEKVRLWIKEAKIQDKMIWLSFIPYSEAPKHIAAMDLATIPFNTKNLTAHFAGPNKLWEYLAQAKSVVATPIPEVLYYRKNLNMVKTAEDYAETITEYSSDPTPFFKKALDGQIEAKNMTWESFMHLMKNVLREISRRCDASNDSFVAN